MLHGHTNLKLSSPYLQKLLIGSYHEPVQSSPYSRYMKLNAEFPPNPTSVLLTLPSLFRKQCCVYSSHFSMRTKHPTLIMTLYSNHPTYHESPSTLEMRSLVFILKWIDWGQVAGSGEWRNEPELTSWGPVSFSHLFHGFNWPVCLSSQIIVCSVSLLYFWRTAVGRENN